MENLTFEDNIKEIMETAKAAFDNCKYKDAEQIFSKIEGSEASAWRILCHIITGDIGKKGGIISTLLQESVNYHDADLADTITSIKILISKYEGAIDRKTKSKVLKILNGLFNHIMKEKMTNAINDISKKAIEMVKEKGYIPSVYDDKAIPLKVLNNKLGRYKFRIRNYQSKDIENALKIVSNENFIQEVVNEYLLISYSNIFHVDEDYLDTKNQNILKYIKSLYTSNMAYEKELKFTRNMDKSQFLDILNTLNIRGVLKIKIACDENIRYFNISNKDEKIKCEKEIEKATTGCIILSLNQNETIEKRGFLIYNGIISQLSKEDIAIGDATNRYTHEYVGPIPGTIYFDN